MGTQKLYFFTVVAVLDSGGGMYNKTFATHIFVHRCLEVNRFVGHHEAFADVSLGPGAHLRRGVLDFTNNKTSGVPVRAQGRGDCQA